MPAPRVNFKEVRESADFGAVLASYGIEMIKDGSRPGQYKALCPFHEDTDPSLKINTDRNIFNCFVCGASGNVIDFVMQMDDVDVRTAALKVAELSNQPAASPTPKPKTKPKAKPKAAKPAPPPEAEELDGEPYNRPLDFELKNLATDHPFFDERRISGGMIKTFGLGIAQRGIMKDRLVFPIHNAAGELVAYCGRWVGEPDEDEPKYKQPPNFRKDLELFNWHRAKATAANGALVVVESFLSAVKLHHWGIPVVCCMGRSLSEQQVVLLQEGHVRSVLLLFDGDDPGQDAIKPASRQLVEAGIAAWSPAVAADFKPHHLPSAKAAKALLAPFLSH